MATATDSFIVVGLPRAAEAWCCKGCGAPPPWPGARPRLEEETGDVSRAGGHVRSDQ